MSTFSPAGELATAEVGWAATEGVNASAAQPVTSGEANESPNCDVGSCQSSTLMDVGSVAPHEVGLESSDAGVSVLAIG